MSELTREEEILLQCLNEARVKIGMDEATEDQFKKIYTSDSITIKAMRMFALEELEKRDKQMFRSDIHPSEQINQLKEKLKQE